MGDYLGGGTVIGPRDAAWFGKGAVGGGTRDDAADIARRRATPLTPQADRRISNLRVDVAGLKRELAGLGTASEALRKKIAASEADLAALLHQHGLPLDPGLVPPVENPGPKRSRRGRAQQRAKTKPKAKK